jgi:hypothetical protein
MNIKMRKLIYDLNREKPFIHSESKCSISKDEYLVWASEMIRKHGFIDKSIGRESSDNYFLTFPTTYSLDIIDKYRPFLVNTCYSFSGGEFSYLSIFQISLTKHLIISYLLDDSEKANSELVVAVSIMSDIADDYGKFLIENDKFRVNSDNEVKVGFGMRPVNFKAQE